MSVGQRLGPAMLLHRIGRGSVLTFACSPGYAVAGEHHIVEVRRLMRNVIRGLNPRPLLEVDAPANVEIVISDDPQQQLIRVHCLCYHPTPQTTPPTNRPYILPGLIEDLPLFRVSLRSNRPLQDVRAVNDSTQVSRDGDRITATIQDIHEVLLLRY